MNNRGWKLSTKALLILAVCGIAALAAAQGAVRGTLHSGGTRLDPGYDNATTLDGTTIDETGIRTRGDLTVDGDITGTITGMQAQADILDAISTSGSSTGFPAFLGTGSIAMRSITGTAGRISVTNGSGVSDSPVINIASETLNELAALSDADGVLTNTSGVLSWGAGGGGGGDLPADAAGYLLNDGAGDLSWNPNVQPLAADLTALAALASNGMLARTGAGTFATRNITGTAASIQVNDGNGVSGAPTIRVADQFVWKNVNLTSGTTVAVNASQGNVFRLTLGHNTTISNPTFPTNHQEILFRIAQDGTGGRTLAWDTAFDTTGVLPVNATANAVTYYWFAYNSTTLKWEAPAKLGTLAAQNAGAAAITGGAINGTPIGASTPSTGAFTTLGASGALTFTGTIGDIFASRAGQADLRLAANPTNGTSGAFIRHMFDTNTSGTRQSIWYRGNGSATTAMLLDHSSGDLTLTRAILLGGSAGTSGQVLTSGGSGAAATWTNGGALGTDGLFGTQIGSTLHTGADGTSTTSASYVQVGGAGAGVAVTISTSNTDVIVEYERKVSADQGTVYTWLATTNSGNGNASGLMTLSGQVYASTPTALEGSQSLVFTNTAFEKIRVHFSATRLSAGTYYVTQFFQNDDGSASTTHVKNVSIFTN